MSDMAKNGIGVVGQAFVVLGTLGGCSVVLFSGIGEIESQPAQLLEGQETANTLIPETPPVSMPLESVQPTVVFYQREKCVIWNKRGKSPETTLPQVTSRKEAIQTFMKSMLSPFPIEVTSPSGKEREGVTVTDWRDFTKIKLTDGTKICPDP